MPYDREDPDRQRGKAAPTDSLEESNDTIA